MNLFSRHFRRVENSVPVFVRPGGGPDANSRRIVHAGRPDVRRLAHVQNFHWITVSGRDNPLHTNSMLISVKADLSRAEWRPNTFRWDSAHCGHSTIRPRIDEHQGPATYS